MSVGETMTTRAMGLLNQVVEMLDEIRIDRLPRHE
jgi:hypothetical protein